MFSNIPCFLANGRSPVELCGDKLKLKSYLQKQRNQPRKEQSSLSPKGQVKSRHASDDEDEEEGGTKTEPRGKGRVRFRSKSSVDLSGTLLMILFRKLEPIFV